MNRTDEPNTKEDTLNVKETAPNTKEKNSPVDFSLGEDYIDIRPLDEGGMGVLYRAYRKGLGVEVVIKRVKRKYASKMDQKSEANIMKLLKHRYLPRIYDIIDGKDGFYYTIMDYIPGENMQKYISKHGPASQKLTYKWACQLCEAVEYLHEQKPPIIHCDIKPSNLMLTPGGDLCLIDFNTSLVFSDGILAKGATAGYAAPEQYVRKMKEAEKAEDASSDEKTLFMGSMYPSPEQRSGTNIGASSSVPSASFSAAATTRAGGYGSISKQTDIYGIGATLYYIVSGKVPEKSLDAVTDIEVYHPQATKTFLEIIRRAMQKEPDKRFSSASEMLRALKDIDQADQKYKNYLMKKRMATIILALCFFFSACSCIYGFFRMRSERENLYLLNLSQAAQAEQAQNYGEGQALLEEAIQMQPNRADAYIQLAAMLYRKGSYQSAVDYIESAFSSGNLTKSELDAAALEQLYYIEGNCYYELKEYAQAVTMLRQATEQPGAGTNSYRSFAIALANSGALDEAKEVLQQLQNQNASSSDCDLVAAEINVAQKKYAEALELYEKVFNEATDVQLLSHAYLSAANAAFQMDDINYSIQLLTRCRNELPAALTVLHTEMLADLYSTQAFKNKGDANNLYRMAAQLLQELSDNGYATISTKLNLATVRQALDEYKAAEEILSELRKQYPQDYRFDMQLAYLMIDWQNSLPGESRDYTSAEEYYNSSKEKYRIAQANGTEDSQMTTLSNLIDQLHTGGWL